MGLLINTDGMRQQVIPTNGKTFSLRELRLYVGGYIERIDLYNGCAMYVDEEGLLKKLPCNDVATEILQRSYTLPCKSIVGNAVIVQYREEK